MCVIAYKARNIEMPSNETLEKCFSTNSHGAGILLHRAGTKILEIHKGFMTYKKFEDQIKELNIKKEDDVIMHFRITTSGGTSEENCHPFPISNKVEDLKATRINTARAFVHNGVLGSGDEKIKISDTQLFVRDVMSRTEIQNNLENEEVKRFISEFAGTGNRFFVADAEKDIFEVFGKWHEDGGIKYSNLTFKNSYRSSDWDYGRGYGYSSNYYGRSTTTTNKAADDIPDINSIVCPICDSKDPMDRLLEGNHIFNCSSCGTIYDDAKFKIFDPKTASWISLIELDNFLSDDEIKKFNK